MSPREMAGVIVYRLPDGTEREWVVAADETDTPQTLKGHWERRLAKRAGGTCTFVRATLEPMDRWRGC